MQHGSVLVDDEVNGWTPIVHRDMKLDNFWLDGYNEEEKDDFPAYPKAMLGDFGIAIMTSDNDPNNQWHTMTG